MTTPAPQGSTITATVRDDGTGEVAIHGASNPFVAADVDAARAQALELVTAEARQQGRPVHLAAVEPTGEWLLLVHPDGRVEAVTDAQPAPTPPAREAHASPLPASPVPPASTDPLTAPPTVPQPPVAIIPSPPAAPAVEQRDDRWSRPAAQDGATGAAPSAAPTLDDLMRSRPRQRSGPAQWGWQRVVRHVTGGLIKPTPGPAELRHREAIASVQRSLSGPRTVVVVNPKGGAHKTTATMLIAATFGTYRGGYVLAWDNNETRGTLGWRGLQARHSNTAVNLLADLDRFTDPTRARVGDLDNYVRSQGSAQFDVLASDEDPGASASIGAEEFAQLHSTLSRFYRVLVVDTGNNMRAPNWEAAVAAADQLVIVSTVREDTAASAAWLVDGLRSKGHDDKVRGAVTLLSAPAKQADPDLTGRLHKHFAQLTRAVVDVPYDPALVDGGPIAVDALRPATRESWLNATAAIADGL